MNTINQDQDNLKQLIGHLGDLLKLLGSAVGASSLGVTLLYMVGFVVVNTSLLRHGAYDISLLRAEFLAAGISYAILTLGMILAGAAAVNWLVEHVEDFLSQSEEGEKSVPLTATHRLTSLVIILFTGAVFLLSVNRVAHLFPAGFQWWQRFGRAVTWGYTVALVGGIYVEYLEREGFWREISAPTPAFPALINPMMLGVGLLMVALVSYGGYAYPYLPKSWGGGSPIYVEFIVVEESRHMLETLGLRIGDEGLSERVEFLTESEERIFVLTQQGDTLSFAPDLVQASKFYDIDYYVSAEAHLNRGDWYREQREWTAAIREYNAALLIQASLLEARIGRGMAHAERYIESARTDTPNNQAYYAANNDLSEAILQTQSDEVKDDQQAAQAYYYRGRLSFYDQNKERAAQDVSWAIRLDPGYLQTAMLEEAFRADVLTDDAFRGEMYNMTVGELAEEYGTLGRFLASQSPEKAPAMYDMAANLAQKALDSPNRLERSAYFYNLKAQALESLSRNEEALDAWRRTLELDPRNMAYHYQYARLAYARGLLEEAQAKCDVVFARGRVDSVTIDCRILQGNLNRDKEMTSQAIEDYTWAAQKAIERGFPSSAASAYYQRARLEAKRGETERAIAWLSKSMWLDRSLKEKAEMESDFNVIRESSAYQKALSPPVVVEIRSDLVERSIEFLLQEPADDFPEHVATLVTQILQLTDVLQLNDAGHAELYAISEDQRLYVFRLKADASHNAAEVAGVLRRLLGLTDETVMIQSAIQAQRSRDVIPLE